MAGNRVTWAEDGSAAYLIDASNNVIGRWFRDRPDMNTFDPSTYGYGGGYGYQAPGQSPSFMYDAWAGGGAGKGAKVAGAGDAGGYYQDPDRMAWDEFVRQFNLTFEESRALREQYQQQFDQDMVLREKDLAQRLQELRMSIESSEGMQRYKWEQEFKMVEQQHQNSIAYLQMDWTERHKALDKELGVRLQEMWSGERLAAAQMAAQPINYRMYEHWMAGLGGQADPSGLPAGAPAFQTGPGMEGAVVPGTAPGASPYAQAYATGARVPEFQAYGGPTTPVGGEPWVSPHKVNLTQFLASPLQSQEMQYGRWRERGFMPYTAEQQMYAAAPTGTARSDIGYG